MLKIIGAALGVVVVVGGMVVAYKFLSGEQKSPTPLSTYTASTIAPTTPTVTSPITQTSEPITNTVVTKKIMTATLHTNKGTITLEFYPQNAPKTVENFIKLAQSGFYDSTKFHRVIRGFMNQGGDPLTKDDSQKARWGTGGPGYKFNDEISSNNSNAAGAVAMANSGPNTQGSQFFINAVDNHNLDQGYTVFGKVVSGMDVVTAINNVPVDPADRPLEPVVLEKVTLD